jgi:CRISPR-associated exonuclease Cas4
MPRAILTCLIFGLLCIWIAGRQRKAAGLPVGRILSEDALTHGRRSPVLYDPDFDLTGRPDYVIEYEGEIVPVEMKSRRAPDEPYRSHVLQLAAYGRRPSRGLLRYRDRSFSVVYTADLERELGDILGHMRRYLRRAPDRAHTSIRRCENCGYRHVCDQALA